jgi:hypothetical protein
MEGPRVLDVGLFSSFVKSAGEALRHRQTDRRELLEKAVTPLYVSLQPVAINYRSTILKAQKDLRAGRAIAEVLADLEEARDEMLMGRNAITKAARGLALSRLEKRSRFDEILRDFVKSIENFFDVGSVIGTSSPADADRVFERMRGYVDEQDPVLAALQAERNSRITTAMSKLIDILRIAILFERSGRINAGVSGSSDRLQHIFLHTAYRLEDAWSRVAERYGELNGAAY